MPLYRQSNGQRMRSSSTADTESTNHLSTLARSKHYTTAVKGGVYTRCRAMQAAGAHRLGSTRRAHPTTASSSTVGTSQSLSMRRHRLSQHEGIAHESRSEAGLGERRGSGDARSRCTLRTSTRTEAGELTRRRSSPQRSRRQRLRIGPPSRGPSFLFLPTTLKVSA
jgi:hypothetical protein